MKDRAKYDINANLNSKAQYEHARTTWNKYQKWKNCYKCSHDKINILLLFLCKYIMCF